MKTLFIVSLLFVTGCFGQTYVATQVGQDRYVVTSKGFDHGAENYGFILKEAYKVCNQSGYKDYTVSGVVHENKRVVTFIKCEEVETTTEREKTADNKKPEDKNNSSTMTELEKFYNEAKKKFAEKQE